MFPKPFRHALLSGLLLPGLAVAQPPLARSSGPPQGLTLDDAAVEAVRNNLDLLAAQYNVPISRADELSAGLWYNPVIAVDTVFQPFKGTWNQTNAGGPRQYDLSLAYPLDLTRKLSKRKASAREAARATEAAFQDAVRQKVLEARLAYVDAMAAAQFLSLAREKETNLQRLVDLVRARIGGPGLLPLVQVRANLQLERAQVVTRQRDSALRTAKTQLSLSLGRRDRGEALELGSRLRDFQFVDAPDAETLLARALAERPDLAALRLARAKASADLALARALVWDNPTLGLGLSSQRSLAPNPNDPASTRLPTANSWGASLAIPLPLFNRNQGLIQRSRLGIEQVDRQIAAQELAIRKEIEALVEQLRLRRELIAEMETEQLKHAVTVRDAQQRLFGTGGHALLEYFDGINAYDETLSDYYDAVAEYRRTIARLNAAVGKDVLR